MSRGMFLVLMMAISMPVLAQDRIGFYFDADGMSSAITTSGADEFVQGWLILEDASHIDDIGAWRLHLEMEQADGTPVAAQWQYLGGAQNFDAPPQFDVGTLTPLPWSSSVVLATVLIAVPDPDQEIGIYLRGHRAPLPEDPAGYSVYQPEYGYSMDYTPATMKRDAGHSYQPVATINSDGLEDPVPPVVTFLYGLEDVVVGGQLAGTLEYRYEDLVRHLEAVVEPVGDGLEFRRTSAVAGDPTPLPGPWVSAPVWTRLQPLQSVATDEYEVRFSSDQVGPVTAGFRLRYGDEVVETLREFEVLATPCSERGFTYGVGGGWMEDGALTFHTMTVTNPPSTGYLSVRNIGDEPFVVTPRITGSTAFTVANPQPVTLEPGGLSHQFDLVFDPGHTGWNEATLGFFDDACATVILRGYAVVVSGAEDLPGSTRLLPAHPNPFNPATTVSFELARAGRARVAVYGLDGRLVKVLADEEFAAGPAQRTWSGRDAAGRAVASGVYLVRLEAGDVLETRRITLLK